MVIRSLEAKSREVKEVIMNKVILMGRACKDPEVRYAAASQLAIARFSLAVPRKGTEKTDFLNTVAFGKTAEFIEKYISRGIKVCIVGRVQTDSYTNKEGAKVSYTEIVIEEIEFAEKKQDGQRNNDTPPRSSQPGDGFMNIPDGVEDELPFN